MNTIEHTGNRRAAGEQPRQPESDFADTPGARARSVDSLGTLAGAVIRLRPVVAPNAPPARYADCARCQMRELVLFADLTATELADIHEPILDFRAAAGQLLYDAGGAARHVYTLRSGLVKLVRWGSLGAPRIVGLMRPGDLVGIEALVEPKHRASAVVLRDGDLCRIPVEVIHRMQGRSAQLQRRLAERWHAALDGSQRWITDMNTGTAERRLANLVLFVAAPGSPRAPLFARDDLAAMLGLTAETVSRTLQQFVRKGWVQLRRQPDQQLDLLDRNALLRCADGSSALPARRVGAIPNS